MDPRMIELLDNNFEVNFFGSGEKFWTLDGCTVAFESVEEDDNECLIICFKIDEEESMDKKRIKTYNCPRKIDSDRFDILEKELDGFLTNVKKIRKLFRKSMIEEL